MSDVSHLELLGRDRRPIVGDLEIRDPRELGIGKTNDRVINQFGLLEADPTAESDTPKRIAKRVFDLLS